MFLGFDARVFHLLPWELQAKENPAFFLFLVGIGGAIAYPSLMSFLFPKAILKATREGIQIFAVTTEDKWNEESEEFERIVNSGDPLTIEWDLVETISQGKLCIEGRSKLQADQKITPVEMTALRILCDPSVKLDGFTREGIIHTRSGTYPEDMEASERAAFTKQEFEDYQKSEILIPEKFLNTDTKELVKQMENLKGIC